VTDAELRAAFHEHKDAIYRFAWRMTGSADAAADIAQETFLVMVREPLRFDPIRGNLRAFLLGVARNITRRWWRDEQRWDELEDTHLPAVALDTEVNEISRMVATAVQSLAPLQCEVVILAQYEEMSLEEIARIVDAEVGTVKSRLFRARENLRRMLAPLRPISGGRDATAKR
jgi:RNA polymerase sigma-70 factor (ECF subfamily)